MKVLLWIVYIIAMIKPVSYGYYEGKRNNYAGMTVVWLVVLASVILMKELLMR